MRIDRSDADWQERGQVGMVAFMQSSLLFHLVKSLYLAPRLLVKSRVGVEKVT